MQTYVQRLAALPCEQRIFAVHAHEDVFQPRKRALSAVFAHIVDRPVARNGIQPGAELGALAEFFAPDDERRKGIRHDVLCGGVVSDDAVGKSRECIAVQDD